MGLIDTGRKETDACCFLASEQASFVTGQVLHANGETAPIPNIVPPE